MIIIIIINKIAQLRMLINNNKIIIIILIKIVIKWMIKKLNKQLWINHIEIWIMMRKRVLLNKLESRNFQIYSQQHINKLKKIQRKNQRIFEWEINSKILTFFYQYFIKWYIDLLIMKLNIKLKNYITSFIYTKKAIFYL